MDLPGRGQLEERSIEYSRAQVNVGISWGVSVQGRGGGTPRHSAGAEQGHEDSKQGKGRREKQS